MTEKILIVDDEYSIRESLKMYFISRGFQASIASSGEQAAEMLQKDEFDLVVSDIRMDKMDGVELVKKMKQYNQETPVIFITAYPGLDTAIEAVREGVVDYLIKPFDMDDIERKVKKALSLQKAKTSSEIKKQVEKNKDEFLSAFSDEFKSPVNPLEAYATLLLKEEYGEINEMQKEVLNHILRNSGKIKKMSDDLMMLYGLRTNDGGVKPEVVDLIGLINGIMESESEFAGEKEIKMEVTVCDGIEQVYCDRMMIQRVIFHLINNAVKFSFEKSDVDIRVSSYKYNENRYVKFSITNRGGVIPEPGSRLMFRQFYEYKKLSDSPDIKPFKGLGIGLTLSKAIVDAHFGKIWIEGIDGENTVSFILPDVNL